MLGGRKEAGNTAWHCGTCQRYRDGDLKTVTNSANNIIKTSKKVQLCVGVVFVLQTMFVSLPNRPTEKVLLKQTSNAIYMQFY